MNEFMSKKGRAGITGSRVGMFFATIYRFGLVSANTLNRFLLFVFELQR